MHGASFILQTTRPMDKPFRKMTDSEFRQLTPAEKRAYTDEAMKRDEAICDAEFARTKRRQRPRRSTRNAR
jgi:hypothetical protein